MFILIDVPFIEKFIDNKLIAKLGIIFKALAQLIFVEKIIEYFMLPYYLDNKFYNSFNPHYSLSKCCCLLYMKNMRILKL